MYYETITYEREGNIAIITLNRPEVLNAFNIKMTEEIDEAIKESEKDGNVHVIIITGAGRAFSSGYDLGEMDTYPFDDVEKIWEFEYKKDFERMLNIWNCSKPIIAAVNGYAIAAGFILMSMCDIVIASEEAKFGMPAAKLMAAADLEISVIPWLVGIKKAKEFLFLGDMISANEAKEMGFINRIVPGDKLMDEAKDMADKIAKAAPFAIRMTKASLNRTLDIMGFTSALKAHFDTHILTHATSEGKVLQKELMEKGIKSAPYKKER